MKRTIPFLSAVVLVALMAFGCDDEVESLSTDSSAVDRVRAGDLTFTLQILNMQGEPQALFQEGENFQFQFVIENTGKDGYQSSLPWHFPVANSEFFALYRKTQESGGKAYIGKFFRMGENFRDFKLIAIPGNTTLAYTIPWLVKEDSVYIMPEYEGKISESVIDRQYIKTEMSPPPIKAGEYFTGFTVQYGETDSLYLITSFTVE